MIKSGTSSPRGKTSSPGGTRRVKSYDDDARDERARRRRRFALRRDGFVRAAETTPAGFQDAARRA